MRYLDFIFNDLMTNGLINRSWPINHVFKIPLDPKAYIRPDFLANLRERVKI